MPKVKPGKETVKFLAIFDHLLCYIALGTFCGLHESSGLKFQISNLQFHPMILRAAHNAARAASESLVMNETRVHVVITDVRWSNPQHASSVVNVPSRAGQARFRAAALSQRCSFVNGATRSLVCGALWLPNLCKKGEGQVVCASLFLAHRNHRSRDDGTESSSGRINWGPSAGRALRAIMMKSAVAGRSSDVAIVSNEAGGQHNRWRSQGPLGRCVASDAVSAAGRESDYGIKRARKRKPLWTRQSHREVAKDVSDSLLEAVLGKTRRTEFQRGQGKRNERSDDCLPRCPKGLRHRKPLTYSCSRLCSTRPVMILPLRCLGLT